MEFDPIGHGTARLRRCCEVRRQLAEQFAIAARLYAETVVDLTTIADIAQADYKRLCEAAEEAQRRSEAACVAFEEHVDSHRCAAYISTPVSIR
jgi:hypothetical protein